MWSVSCVHESFFAACTCIPIRTVSVYTSIVCQEGLLFLARGSRAEFYSGPRIWSGTHIFFFLLGLVRVFLLCALPTQMYGYAAAKLFVHGIIIVLTERSNIPLATDQLTRPRILLRVIIADTRSKEINTLAYTVTSHTPRRPFWSTVADGLLVVCTARHNCAQKVAFGTHPQLMRDGM